MHTPNDATAEHYFNASRMVFLPPEGSFHCPGGELSTSLVLLLYHPNIGARRERLAKAAPPLGRKQGGSGWRQRRRRRSRPSPTAASLASLPRRPVLPVAVAADRRRENESGSVARRRGRSSPCSCECERSGEGGSRAAGPERRRRTEEERRPHINFTTNCHHSISST